MNADPTTTTPPGATAEPTLHIRSAEDLLRALRSSTLAARARVVGALVHDPSLARAYGAHEGDDAIAELCRQLDRERSPSYVELLVDALVLQAGDRRAERALARRLDDAPTPVALARIATCLARSAEPSVRGELSRRALAAAPYETVLLCARALATRSDLDTQERVRAAVVPGGRPELAPALDDTTRDAWLAELDGPFAEGARAVVATSPSLAPLGAEWSRLASGTRAWLVSLVTSDAQRSILDDALLDESASVVAAAIRAARRVAPSLLSTRLAMDPRRDVRFAYARSCRHTIDVDPVAAFENEHDSDVRVLWVEAVAARGDLAHLAALVCWLDADHWSVRAASTAALVRLGPPAADALKGALSGLSQTARVGAAQALMQLGHHEWLEHACAV